MTLTPVAERLSVEQSMLDFTPEIPSFYIMSNIEPRCVLKNPDKLIKRIPDMVVYKVTLLHV